MDSDLADRKPKQSLLLAKLGTILYTGPIWGIFGTIIGMSRAFATLKTGEADHMVLAQNIEFAMLTTFIGLAVGIIGAVLIIISLYRHKNHPSWFFWSTLILSAGWCFYIFPIGIFVGLPTAAMFLTRRKEFGK